MSIKIIQYNILCQKLANPNYHKCKPEDLEEKKRWENIVDRLMSYIDGNCIICLQEISQTWCGKMYDLFISQNYGFIYSSYGSQSNDYMGVAIAYPTKIYNTSNTQIINIGSKIKIPTKEPKIFYKKLVTASWENLNYYLGKCWISYCKNTYDRLQKDKFDCWNYSRKRNNAAIVTTFTDLVTKKQFVVSTYHMPCTYWQPRVSTIHVVHLFKTLHQYAGNIPIIVGTDANITPNSYQYKLATEGTIDIKNSQHPQFDNDLVAWVNDFKPMKSAYKILNTIEPRFTNKSSTLHTNGIFSDTLDYIFFTGNIEPTYTMDIPEYDDNVILPNDDEPSDHIPIGASFEFVDCT